MHHPLALAPLAVLALLLAGCSATPEQPAPTPAPSELEELFASEEEAVAAADALIKEYWAATDTIFQAGGEGVELLEPLVTDRRMESEIELAETFLRQDLTQTGAYSVDSTTFQQTYESDGTTHLLVTTCVDHSLVDIVDPSGASYVERTATNRRLHQVTLHSSPKGLLLDQSKPWDESEC